MFAIIADRITPAERERIHGIVKEHANGWWHHFADLWIVGGESASRWHELISVAIPDDDPSGVLIVKLDTGRAQWAWRARLKESGQDWIRENL